MPGCWGLGLFSLCMLLESRKFQWPTCPEVVCLRLSGQQGNPTLGVTAWCLLIAPEWAT